MRPSQQLLAVECGIVLQGPVLREVQVVPQRARCRATNQRAGSLGSDIWARLLHGVPMIGRFSSSADLGTAASISSHVAYVATRNVGRRRSSLAVAGSDNSSTVMASSLSTRGGRHAARRGIS